MRTVRLSALTLALLLAACAPQRQSTLSSGGAMLPGGDVEETTRSFGIDYMSMVDVASDAVIAAGYEIQGYQTLEDRVILQIVEKVKNLGPQAVQVAALEVVIAKAGETMNEVTVRIPARHVTTRGADTRADPARRIFARIEDLLGKSGS